MSRQGEIELTWFNEEGEEVTHSFPSKNEVCHDCEGHGTVLNEGMRYYAYTSEDEEFHDPEFREEYFKRGGIYDVQCPTCKGKNVEEVVDESRLSEEQKKLYAEYEENQEEMARMDEEDRHTRYMESGGYGY